MADKNKKDSHHDEDETEDLKQDSPRLGETIKKVLSMGTAAAFLTEETVKSYLADIKLPKEVLQLILQGVGKSKDEITQRVTKEIVNILSQVDWAKEAKKFAETHKFKITAEIDIIKKEDHKK